MIQGRCFCVYPSDMANQYPGFYPTESSLGGLSQQVTALRGEHSLPFRRMEGRTEGHF
jgi:hypothetical protein